MSPLPITKLFTINTNLRMHSTSSLFVFIHNINRKFYNTHSRKSLESLTQVGSNSCISLPLHPDWITGFSDGEFHYPKLVDLYSLRSKFNPCRVGIRQVSSKRSCSNSLSLVVWGTNLTSLVGFGRLTKQESNIIELPPYQFSVIIGLLLSDGD